MFVYKISIKERKEVTISNIFFDRIFINSDINNNININITSSKGMSTAGGYFF